MFYQNHQSALKCTLCPHECVMALGQVGQCMVRENKNGKINLKVYGKVSSIAFDPIEKKPLYHFYPGSKILSIGSYGCNLKCNFCQNWQISQISEHKHLKGTNPTIQKLISEAQSHKNCIGIAYTYNEPTVWYEFMVDVATKAKKSGLKNVMVSNGYINEEPLLELMNVIDAFNIDLKAFSSKFYKEATGGNLASVLNTLKLINKHNKHLEVTNLIIPTLNDTTAEFNEMVNWIANELGSSTVLHISRYFPHYKQKEPSTPNNKLIEFYNLAKQKLKYVYLGNQNNPLYSQTLCSNCGELLIERQAYKVSFLQNYNNGYCLNCGDHSLEGIQ